MDAKDVLVRGLKFAQMLEPDLLRETVLARAFDEKAAAALLESGWSWVSESIEDA